VAVVAVSDTEQETMQNVLVKQCYEKLETARRALLEFAVQSRTKVSLRHLEEKWGEYYVANELVNSGISISGKIGSNKGPDITTVNQVRIEVKTSRRTPRFKGAKRGYSWAVKSSQWKNREFDYLVCVTADEDRPKTLAFTYDEVVENMTLCNFVWRRDTNSTGDVCRDYRLLDLTDDGEKGLQFNRTLASTVLQFEGQPTTFEVAFNRNPNPYFEEYQLKRILEQIKEGLQKDKQVAQ
jgi:hypothetical protein